jgi:hypothetical protein
LTPLRKVATGSRRVKSNEIIKIQAILAAVVVKVYGFFILSDTIFCTHIYKNIKSLLTPTPVNC